MDKEINLKDAAKSSENDLLNSEAKRTETVEEGAVNSDKDRAKGFEGCPGCVNVDIKGMKCTPGDARVCPISWFNAESARRAANA